MELSVWKASLLAIAVAIALTIAFYYRSPATLELLQTAAADFDTSLLLEKQPLIIHDKITETGILQESLFGGRGRLWAAPTGCWERVAHAHGILHALTDVEVLCAPPKVRWAMSAPTPDSQLVAFTLKQHQTLILPFRWGFFLPEASNVHLLGVHDAWSWMLPAPFVGPK